VAVCFGISYIISCVLKSAPSNSKLALVIFMSRRAPRYYEGKNPRDWHKQVP
jgi:hypothetical protein